MAYTRAELKGVEKIVSDILDDYMHRFHGLISSWAYPDWFLKALDERGYAIIETAELAQLKGEK